MKVVVTGGAGFIGSHLSRKLIHEGHEVVIIDELHPYYSINRKNRHLEFIKESGEFRFFQKSLIHNEKEVRDIFLSFQPEAVIHLAAIPGVPHSIEVPNEYVDYDIKATINALRFAGDSDAKQFIFASSSSVYGEQKNVPLEEEMATGRVVSPYAAAKFSAEAFCHAYASLFPYKVSILRFFTVYGPWGRPDMAITKFIKKLLAKEEITLFGKGTARDYTYIDDCVNGILSAFNQKVRVGTYNIGSGRPIYLEELVDKLRGHFPELNVGQGAFRQGDVHSTWADIRKAKEQLGYYPSVSFSEGLANTIEWAKKHETEIC
ncbi:GDP-mannose 4,6-dehydratase [Paenibacillus sp. BSR1-1]|uniref:NAD-dependent epimerase/dehydratase family protein n=1 Tax=Paenibacillus sp. BSR1-1 TaxID=3020845 RepID=UPI0025B0E940|nr:NAD-dependent epimerase/dehydratase family protein [Paenibacillus sp. BSR1-1]MDN3018800.1 GDP-mannose 4,6-dehydratase [Paenibacillus sp. BSR1-1]